MFAGCQTYNSGKIGELGHYDLVGKLDTVSVVSMSLLRLSDDPENTGRFALVCLPMIGLLPTVNGELRSGITAGLQFRVSQGHAEQPSRKPPQKSWSVHAQASLSNGRLDKVVIAIRCNGVLVGTISPIHADAAALRARNEKYGKSVSHDQDSDSPHAPTRQTPLRFFEALEEDFQAGILCRPYEPREIVIVQSYGCSAMRYAALGVYANETALAPTNMSLDESLASLKQNFLSADTLDFSGVIID